MKAAGLRKFVGSGGQQRAEIKRDELSKDFLAKEIAPNGVRGIKAKVMLEEKERSFDSPAKVIKLLKIGRRTATPGKIGDEILKTTRVEPYTNKAKCEVEDRRLIVEGDKIEATLRTELTAQPRREQAKRYRTSGEEEFRIDIAFPAISNSRYPGVKTLSQCRWVGSLRSSALAAFSLDPEADARTGY